MSTGNVWGMRSHGENALSHMPGTLGIAEKSENIRPQMLDEARRCMQLGNLGSCHRFEAIVFVDIFCFAIVSSQQSAVYVDT